MLSSSIFYSVYNILFGIMSLFIGIGSVLFIRGTKEFRGLFLFQIGGLAVVLLTYLAANEHILYRSGLNFNFVSFVELVLALLISVIWINSASELISSTPANREIQTVYITLSLSIGLYYCFIAYNQTQSSTVNSFLTILGLSVLLFAVLLRCIRSFSIGSLLLFISVFMLWGKLLISAYFFNYSWLNLNILNWCWIYVFTAAVIFLKIENLKYEIRKNWNVIDKLNLQIAAMVDFSPFPIMIARITDGKLLLLNKKAGDLLGISKKESAYFKLKDFFVDEENRDNLFALLEKNHEVQDFDLMVCNLINASPFWLSVSAKTIEYNNEMAFYMAFQNITLRKARETSLKFQADRDPLTLAWNRRHFEKLVPERIENILKKGQNFSLLMIDADKFKNVNDTYGHKIGDKVLTELVACCQSSLREDDIVCRFGGEEFVIYLDNTNTQSAQTVAERLLRNISELAVETENGEKIHFTVSIGVVSSESTASLEILLRQVDDAMYLAKRSGRNCVAVYDEQKIKSDHNKKADSRRQIHPVFQNEETEEISLLDNYENKIL